MSCSGLTSLSARGPTVPQRTSSTSIGCRSSVSPHPLQLLLDPPVLIGSGSPVSLSLEGVTSEMENHEKRDILVLVEKGR